MKTDYTTLERRPKIKEVYVHIKNIERAPENSAAPSTTAVNIKLHQFFNYLKFTVSSYSF